MRFFFLFFFFFFNDTATTEIYTLSLHDALPIYVIDEDIAHGFCGRGEEVPSIRVPRRVLAEDRKSTRLNSSHVEISYAVFCLKKKKNKMSSSGERKLLKYRSDSLRCQTSLRPIW